MISFKNKLEKQIILKLKSLTSNKSIISFNNILKKKILFKFKSKSKSILSFDNILKKKIKFKPKCTLDWNAFNFDFSLEIIKEILGPDPILSSIPYKDINNLSHYLDVFIDE
jgi:hypothetical protein